LNIKSNICLINLFYIICIPHRDRRKRKYLNSQDFSTASSKLLPNASGNLNSAQQIIYIYGPRQWKTQDDNNLKEKARDDYLTTSNMGAHKLHLRKLPWNKARKTCIQEGGEFLTILFDDEYHRNALLCFFYHFL